MKRYGLFIISFIVLLGSFQLLSGMILTLLYVPESANMWNSIEGLSSKVIFGSHLPSFAFVIPVLAATAAFFISKKRVRKSS
ncbi:hypothetical protein V8V54_20760 [Priestia megaterium]|uniref:hypothetical protein n=1 Tax=Priestia megaterium TaxID=1404 RepID=UPI000BF373E5|nr:hypothetical protein [Priestia megaterium]MCM3155127.1 hypothetical protein [Priestia megaterium]PFW46743.1 hypothetical protein COL17_23125 [Priestia megaterium]